MSALAPVQIPVKCAEVVKRRLQPLHLRYWDSRGFMSVEEALMSAYIQGFEDHGQMLEQMEERKLDYCI